jgi:hypothetical protein
MIASWRGLAIAAALAVVLTLVVVADLVRTPGAVDRALLPGFDPDRVTELIWERAGQPALRVVRAGNAWEARGAASPGAEAAAPPGVEVAASPGAEASAPVPADPSTVCDVLAALRGARVHRRGEPPPVHATLTVVAGGARHVLGIGEPIVGTEQAWLAADGRGVVVDRWAARALDRDRLALRIKAPLADIRRAQTITLAGELGGPVELHLAGHPRQLVVGEKVLLAADLADELERALGDVTIVRLPAGPVTAHGLSITTTGPDATAGRLARGDRAVAHLTFGGSCPGAPELVAISGTAGDGCVERAAVGAIEHAISRLQQPPAAIVESRPVPFEPARIVLADATVLDTIALRAGDHPAEPARVAEFLAALAAPAEVAPLPAGPAADHLTVTGREGAAITLDLYAEHVLARHGEPVALRPAPGAFRLLVRPSRELRDVALWLEEPTSISAVQIDGILYQRGAVIGDWTRRAAGAADAGGTKPADGRPADAKALEALVGLLAAPRALGFVDDAVPAAHRVTLTITPPVGAPTEHVLVLGAPRPAGCPARLEHETILLPAVVCTQVAALAK